MEELKTGFNMVNLDCLKKELEELDDMESNSLLRLLIKTAIQEIQMHRKFNKPARCNGPYNPFNKPKEDYNDYLRFINADPSPVKS